MQSITIDYDHRLELPQLHLTVISIVLITESDECLTHCCTEVQAIVIHGVVEYRYPNDVLSTGRHFEVLSAECHVYICVNYGQLPSNPNFHIRISIGSGR